MAFPIAPSDVSAFMDTMQDIQNKLRELKILIIESPNGELQPTCFQMVSNISISLDGIMIQLNS